MHVVFMTSSCQFEVVNFLRESDLVSRTEKAYVVCKLPIDKNYKVIKFQKLSASRLTIGNFRSTREAGRVPWPWWCQPDPPPPWWGSGWKSVNTLYYWYWTDIHGYDVWSESRCGCGVWTIVDGRSCIRAIALWAWLGLLYGIAKSIGYWA